MVPEELPGPVSRCGVSLGCRPDTPGFAGGPGDTQFPLTGDNIICGSYDSKLAWFDLDLSTRPYQLLR